MNWNARCQATQTTYRSLTLEQLRALILDGELGAADEVQREGEDRWSPIAAVPELADALPAFTFRRRPWPAGEESMDMTPMIDVVFQLLLFFMIISTFQVQKSIQFPQDSLQKQQAQQAPTLGQLGRDRVIVDIDADNQIHLLHYDEQNRLTEREPLRPDQLVERFQRLAVEELKTSVIIKVDDRAEHGTVVAVIDAASLADMQEVRIAQPVASSGGSSQ